MHYIVHTSCTGTYIPVDKPSKTPLSENGNSALRKCKFCMLKNWKLCAKNANFAPKKLQWHSKQTTQKSELCAQKMETMQENGNSALRKWKFCTKKMEFISIPNHGKSAFPWFSGQLRQFCAATLKLKYCVEFRGHWILVGLHRVNS